MQQIEATSPYLRSGHLSPLQSPNGGGHNGGGGSGGGGGGGGFNTNFGVQQVSLTPTRKTLAEGFSKNLVFLGSGGRIICLEEFGYLIFEIHFGYLPMQGNSCIMLHMQQ